jgi:hypothetical protein
MSRLTKTAMANCSLGKFTAMTFAMTQMAMAWLMRMIFQIGAQTLGVDNEP